MPADTFQIKRGTTAAVNAYLPAVGEPVYDITLKELKIGDGVTLGGVAPTHAATADKLFTARNITLSGSVTGTVAFDGSANVSIATSVGASLQGTLDSKAPLASPALTGAPTTPTASAGTNTTQLASTAFVEAARVILVAADALKAPLASPNLTGVPVAPTPAVGTNTTQLATSAMVQAEIANKRAWTSYTPTVTGSTGTYTAASATGKYMIAFGICFFEAVITITTIGTGTKPVITMPAGVTALAGTANMPLCAWEAVANGRVGRAIVTAALNTLQVSGYDNLDLVTANGSVIYINGTFPVA